MTNAGSRRLLLVTNPAAQRVRGSVRREVAARLGRGFAVEHVETKDRGHATEIAARAPAEGFDLLVVLGGDGAVNEAVNGLAGTALPLAVLPGGGANIFARSLGFPRTIRAATEHVLRRASAGPEAVRRVPLGRAGGRYFAANCGLGFDAEIVRSVERRPVLKRAAGAWYFVWEGVGIYALRTDHRTPHLTVSWDGQEAGARNSLHMAVVQNTDPYTFFGRRPIRLCPSARLGDGLDLFSLDSMRLRTVIPILLSAFGRARHERNRHVVSAHGRSSIRIVSDVPLPFQMDGELIDERTEVLAESVPDALSVLEG